MQYITTSPERTEALGERLGERLRGAAADARLKE